MFPSAFGAVVGTALFDGVESEARYFGRRYAGILHGGFCSFATCRAAGRTAEEKELLARAQYWKNLFNPNATPTEGFLQARNPDGTWKTFDPASTDGFVEGTGAQYLWMVPFNVRGLFRLLGGNEEAIRRLDNFFHDAQGNWRLLNGKLYPGFDNEPCLETPWLYDFAGAPYKTQQTVRAILNTLWHDTPGGIPGNDDLGEMSSWYVWAALGMYPEIPGRAELVLASPFFPGGGDTPAIGDHPHKGSPTECFRLFSLRACT